MPQSQQSYYPEKTRDAIWTAGSSLSNIIACGSGTLAALDVPAGWTAAQISFLGSDDGIHFSVLTDYTGTIISFPVVASQKMLIDHLDGNAYLKLQSADATNTPVNQVSAVIVVCTIKKPPISMGFRPTP